MAFGKITAALAIQSDATASYTFYAIPLLGPATAPVVITCRHAGDGTPAYKRASWRAANAARAQRAGLGKTLSEARTRAWAVDEAQLIADHAVVSWENVYEDGAKEPTPCTPDKVHEFLCSIIDATEGLALYVAFREWATDPTNFRPAEVGDGTELGKSSPRG